MKIVNKINNMLEIPREIYTKEPKIEIIGFNNLIIENYKGILEYEENYIKISTYFKNININGINLKLNRMTEDNLKIVGKIISITTE